jgi:hypothetical protein
MNMPKICVLKAVIAALNELLNDLPPVVAGVTWPNTLSDDLETPNFKNVLNFLVTYSHLTVSNNTYLHCWAILKY